MNVGDIALLATVLQKFRSQKPLVQKATFESDGQELVLNIPPRSRR